MAIFGPITDSRGSIVRVSTSATGTEGNNSSYEASLSADGRYVAFYSSASNLIGDDTNDETDVFIKDLVTGAIVRASTDASGNQGHINSYYDDDPRVIAGQPPVMSAAGDHVAFVSFKTNLVAGDTNIAGDVFVKNLTTGVVVRANTNAAGGEAIGKGDFGVTAMSADGRYVAFTSSVANLVPGYTYGLGDIFVKDLTTGAIVCASTSAAGGAGNGRSDHASLSADGQHVAFWSEASNLVSGDTNGTQDVFVKDIVTGAIVRASTDAAGNQGNGASGEAALSAAGDHVVFYSSASNLVAGDTNGAGDIFAKDLVSGSVVLVSSDANGNEGNGYSYRASVSADGRYVAFVSDATNLVPHDTNDRADIFVKDLLSGEILRISTGVTGNQAFGPDLATNTPWISADGSLVSFVSEASNLVSGDTNNASDVFVKTVGSNITGTGGADKMTGSFAADTLNGASGNDVIDGKDGNDFLNGVAGDDTLRSGGGNDSVAGGAGNNSLSGGDGADTLAGAGGNDGLVGGNGNDVLLAGAGIDNLSGGAGKDTLAGERGDDVLAGGQAADWFVFTKPSMGGGLGHDVITDFQDGVDKLSLSVYTAADVSIDAAQQLITLADGSTILLANFTGTLDAGDFLFA